MKNLTAVLSAAACAFALSLAGTASAEPGRGGEKRHEAPAFPMKAETFQAREAAREAKWKGRFEQKIQKLAPAQAKAARERMTARLERVHAKVAEVTKDGTVTKDEAREVRKAGHGGKGRHGGKREGK